MMIQLFRRLKTDGFKDMQYLNLGGGLSIPYRQHVSRNMLEWFQKQKRLCTDV